MKLNVTKVSKMIQKNSPAIIKTVFKGCEKHSAEIFTGLSIAGIASTAVFAVKNTVKAVDIIKEAEEEADEPLTKKEKVVLTWKCYIPTVSSAVVTGICIGGINTSHKKRTATMAAACEAMRHMASDYKDAVIEVLDEDQYEKVEKKYNENLVKSTPFDESTVIHTGTGTDLFYDKYGGRFFYSSTGYIERTVGELNALLSDFGDSVDLNTLFELLKLPPIEFGDEKGWYSDPKLDYVRPIYDSTLTTDLRSAVVVEYSGVTDL